MLDFFRLKTRLRVSHWIGYVDRDELRQQLAIIRKHEGANVHVSEDEVRDARRSWTWQSLLFLSPVAGVFGVLLFVGVPLAAVAPQLVVIAAVPVALVVATYPTLHTLENRKRAGDALLECLRHMVGPRQ